MACLKRPLMENPSDFCGQCSNCTRIALSFPLADRVDEAISARDELRESEKSETRILIQTHPDVLVIPPDPPQLLIKIGQVRSVIQKIYRLPAQSPSSIYLFTSAAFMKEAANSLLKILEEPPPHAHVILLADNPGELLPTIRSRACHIRLGALAPAQLEDILAERRPAWTATERGLVARLAEGAAGRALTFDLEAYRAQRKDALLLLRSAVGSAAGAGAEVDYSALFRLTETYRAGAEGQEKTDALLRAFASLLEDLLLLHSGAPRLVRNADLTAELTRLSEAIDLHWIEAASQGLRQLQQGMRRNALRSLALDSFAICLG